VEIAVGRSRGGSHENVDRQNRRSSCITPGQAVPSPLVASLIHSAIVTADKAYDADRLRATSRIAAPSPTFPTLSGAKSASLTKALYRERKQCRAVLQQAKTVPADLHPLRQARCQFHGFHPTHSRQLSPRPSCAGLSRRNTIINVIKSHDVVLAQVAPHLYFDQLQRNLTGVTQPVNSA
jgi:hypothetical protein